jgi:phospholipase C
VLSFGLS